MVMVALKRTIAELVLASSVAAQASPSLAKRGEGLRTSAIETAAIHDCSIKVQKIKDYDLTAEKYIKFLDCMANPGLKD